MFSLLCETVTHAALYLAVHLCTLVCISRIHVPW